MPNKYLKKAIEALEDKPIPEGMDVNAPILTDKENVASLIAYAKSAPINHVHYLQLSSCPMSSVRLIMNPQMEVEDLHFVGVDEVTTVPKSIYERFPVGFKWYITNYGDNKEEFGEDAPMQLGPFKEKLKQFPNKIVDAIRHGNGVKCYKNGDVDNECPHNVVYLHIVDVLNIYVAKNYNKRYSKDSLVKVLIATEGFHMVSEDFVDTFTPSLNSEDLRFMVDNLDIICYQFGYWENDSWLPIRTVPVNHPRFARVYKLCKWERFVYHQNVKYNTLQRCTPNSFQRTNYAL
jgi:hypothetical protein